MKKYTRLLMLSILTMGSITACQSSGSSGATGVTKIDGAKAYDMMKNDSSITVLDVRTSDEYDTGHIKNAVLIPYTDIEDEAETILPDKDAVILVYCRSGHRSAIAAKALADAGYTHIYDFGGIIDWEYETEK